MKSLQQAVTKFKLIKKKISQLPLQQNQNHQNSPTLINFKQPPHTHRPLLSSICLDSSEILTTRLNKKLQTNQPSIKVSEQTERKGKRQYSIDHNHPDELMLKKQQILKQINELLNKKQQILRDLEIQMKNNNSLSASRSSVFRSNSGGKWGKQLKAPNIHQIRLQVKKKSQEKSIKP